MRKFHTNLAPRRRLGRRHFVAEISRFIQTCRGYPPGNGRREVCRLFSL